MNRNQRLLAILSAILLALCAALAVLLLLRRESAGRSLPRDAAAATGQPAPAPTPTPLPTPSPTPSENDLAPTVTPKITFVPILSATRTPAADGSTPEPTPPWASPYPSPSGAPTVQLGDSVRLGVVTAGDSGAYVRKRAKKSGSSVWGVARTGERYTILERDGEFCRILYNGVEGYISAENIREETVSLRQTGLIAYTIGTLNVHSVSSSSRLRKIADVLRETALDVVGLQEVSRNTLSGGETDWLKKLAGEAGYPYYAFCQTIPYDGGEFGTAILSRYPIVEAASWPLDVAQGKEPRSLAYACILMEKGPVHVFNTHLCASEMHLKSINIASMAYTLRAAGLAAYTVTGDFNCSPPRIHKYAPELHFVNIDKNTFGDGTRIKIIDNILYTDGIVASDVRLVNTKEMGVTDHDLLVSTFHVLLPET